MVLESLLVVALLLRDAVLGVDEAAAVVGRKIAVSLVFRYRTTNNSASLTTVAIGHLGRASAMRAVAWKVRRGRREARSRRGEAYAILNCCRWSLGVEDSGGVDARGWV